jgi:hypothetical protein
MAGTAREIIEALRGQLSEAALQLRAAHPIVEAIVDRLEDGEEVDPAELLVKLTEVRDAVAEALLLLE